MNGSNEVKNRFPLNIDLCLLKDVSNAEWYDNKQLIKIMLKGVAVT
jgi:hypothetical protein